MKNRLLSIAFAILLGIAAQPCEIVSLCSRLRQ